MGNYFAFPRISCTFGFSAIFKEESIPQRDKVIQSGGDRNFRHMLLLQFFSDMTPKISDKVAHIHWLSMKPMSGDF